MEHYNSFTKQRKDLLGFIDILSIGDGKTIGIQTTTKSNMNARINKIINECEINAVSWLLAGNKILVHGWGKKKIKRGGKAYCWHLNEIEITLDNFEHKRR